MSDPSSNQQREQIHPFEEPNDQSLERKVDELLNKIADFYTLNDKHDAKQEYRQFEELLANQILVDYHSLGSIHQQAINLNSADWQKKVIGQEFQDCISTQIQQQVSKQAEQFKALLLLKEKSNKIQLNESSFVKKHFGSHHNMNKSMTEAGRYVLLHNQYYLTTYPRFKQLKEQETQERLQILKNFYKEHRQELEVYLPSQRQCIQKDILPKKLVLFQKNKLTKDPLSKND